MIRARMINASAGLLAREVRCVTPDARTTNQEFAIDSEDLRWCGRADMSANAHAQNASPVENRLAPTLSAGLSCRPFRTARVPSIA